MSLTHFYLLFYIFSSSFFSLKDVIIKISNITIENHFCQLTNSEGCIFNAIYSKITLWNLTLSNVMMKMRSIGLATMESEISISDSSVQRVFCETSPCFLKAFKGHSVIINSSHFGGFGRLAFLLDECSLFFLKNNVTMDKIAQNLTVEEGFLVCLNYGKVQLENSEFSFIKGENGGVFKFVSTKNPSSELAILISGNLFKSNMASNSGGAIYIDNGNANFTKNLFLSNSATNGGALSLNCRREKSSCLWLIEECIFEDNEALKSGGGFFWVNSLPREKNNKFINNKAIHGPDRASSPVKILNANSEIEDLISGQAPSSGLNFTIVDAYNQVCSTLISLQAYVSFKNLEGRVVDKQRILGNKIFEVKNGTFKIEKAVFISNPGQEAILFLRTDAIYKFSNYAYLFENESNSHLNSSDSYVFAFQAYFRPCIRGEIYKVNENVCLKCTKNSYSFDPSVGKCLDCPPNAICKGDSILAKYNYWAESENSSVLYECNILKDACPGGDLNNPCNKGYWGVLCGNCEYNKLRKYFKNTFSYCIDCQDKNIILTICLLIFFSFCIFLQLMLTLKECVQAPSRSRDITPSLLMNFLINYLVLAGTAKGFMSSINSIMKQLFEISNFIFELDNTSDITTCFLGEFVPLEAYSLFQAKQIFNTFIWILLLASPYAFLLVLKLFRRNRRYGWSKIISLYISLFKLLLQPLIRFYTKNFQCFSIGNQKYLKINPSLQCFGEDHIKIITRVLLPGMTFILFFPLTFMLVYLIKKRHYIQNRDVDSKVWLLTLGYKTKYFYWEYVLLLKKTLLISMPIILGSSPQGCLLTMIMFVLWFMLIQKILNPYKSDSLNFLGSLQNFSLFMTYGYTLISTSNQSLIFLYAFAIGCFLSNTIFIFYWGHFFFHVYISKISKKGLIGRILNALTNSFHVFSKKITPVSSPRRRVTKCRFDNKKLGHVTN